ncbi:MAG: ceramidase domain-containing protein [Pseudobdellovibrio sp.]
MSYQNPHQMQCTWYDMAEKYGAPNIKWCEQTLCQFISEPANTWSNLGFLIMAVLIYVYATKNKHPWALKQFGPIVFVMGLLSFIYHFSNFYITQIFDFVGMFLFVGWTLGRNLIRLQKLKPDQLLSFNLMYTVVLTGILHIMYVSEIKFQILIIISGLLIIATEFMVRKKVAVDYKWFWVTLGLLVVAFGFSLSDHEHIWCVPENHGWFEQGHAIWHWTSSVAMFTLYLFQSQEKLRNI